MFLQNGRIGTIRKIKMLQLANFAFEKWFR